MASESAPSRKILLVDDSRTIRTLIKVYLINHGFEYLEAGDGQLALALVQSQPVELVIADFNMPKLDGLAFVDQLRRSPDARLKSVPVIFLTASKDPALEARAVKSGVNAFARKPVTQEELVAVVDRLLPKNK